MIERRTPSGRLVVRAPGSKDERTFVWCKYGQGYREKKARGTWSSYTYELRDVPSEFMPKEQ